MALLLHMILTRCRTRNEETREGIKKLLL